MEEGVLNELLRGPLGACTRAHVSLSAERARTADVFDPAQLLASTSGSGNNWACGFAHYGPTYREALLEQVRRAAEATDSLQSFLLMHSLGGGTGSGLGSYLLGELADNYPSVFRFAASIFPSEDDDVVTSPYNSTLAAASLMEHADVVLPMDNGALGDVCAASAARLAKAGRSGGMGGAGKDGKPFDAMNGVAASALLHLTSSVRFQGPLNVDLNEISMNLVPFPRLHFLLSSLAPLAPSPDLASRGAAAGACVPSRTVDALFGDAFSREAQLLRCDPRRSTYLAAALLFRGPVALSDVRRNCARLGASLHMVPWNAEGFKIGLCAAPPPGVPASLFSLANSTAVGQTFRDMHARFAKLRSRNFYLHHYTEYLEVGDMDHAAQQVASLAEEYAEIEARAGPGLHRAGAGDSWRPVGVR
jgi:tubulin epsilon